MLQGAYISSGFSFFYIYMTLLYMTLFMSINISDAKIGEHRLFHALQFHFHEQLFTCMSRNFGILYQNISWNSELLNNYYISITRN